MAPLIRGIDAAFLGVRDPRPHLDLFCDLLGYDVVESGVVPAPLAGALWGEGTGEVPVTVLAPGGCAHGRVILLTVTEPAEAEHPHSCDYGLVAIDLYTRDIDAAHRQLTSAGHRWTAPPITWKVPVDEQWITVTEGFCFAPEGTALVLVEPEAPRGTATWQRDPERPYTELTSVVAHVPDFDAELDFWGPDGLGLDVRYDTTFESEGLEEMAELPAGTRMRMALIAGPQSARIELTRVENRAGGVDRRGCQRTAHALGHSGWLVTTPDIDAALTRVRDRGGVVRGGPVPGAGTLLGGRRVASVQTPNGVPVTVREVAA